MKKFIIVLKYELKEYFTNRAFLILTFALAFLGSALLFLPRFVDLSGVTGVKIVGGEKPAEGAHSGETDSGGHGEFEEGMDGGGNEVYCYLDPEGILREEVLLQVFPGSVWHRLDSAEELEASVKAGCEAGFAVTGETSCDYYVFNKGMMDDNSARFELVLRTIYRENYCAEKGLDYNELMSVYMVPVRVTEKILNKDSGGNYWYCYALVIIVFMLIVYYGQMIAVAITNEKSSRAIEVLVTSATPNSLLFGKVIAGAVGGVFQMGVILGAILLSYQANRAQWGGMLDLFLHIPAQVLAAFLFFGLGGYLFYAFLYGAMGALVSKTEDVSKSVSGLMIMVMVVYFLSLLQLNNIDGSMIRVLSFLPFSSYSSMFARIAMGTVAPWEVAVSFLILAVSIVGTGILGAKIYRMGTLRYGNPIKLSAALKELKKGR